RRPLPTVWSPATLSGSSDTEHSASACWSRVPRGRRCQRNRCPTWVAPRRAPDMRCIRWVAARPGSFAPTGPFRSAASPSRAAGWRRSLGLGIVTLYDALRVDVVRGVDREGRWDVRLDFGRAFWPIL